MRRLILTLFILCCFMLSCAPQQQKVAQENAVGSEQAQASDKTDRTSEKLTQIPPQNNEALEKIEDFFERIPPTVVQKTDAPQDLDSPQETQENTWLLPPHIDEPLASSPPTSFQIMESDIQIPSMDERPEQAPPLQTDERQGVGLNFDNADIHDVTKVVSEITGKSFIVDEEVEGRVTIYSEEPLSPDQVFDLFKSALEMNGLAITQVGDFYKIVTSDDAKTHYTMVDTGPFASEEDRLVTQIVKLKYVSAQEVKEALSPLTQTEIIVYPDQTGNTLIITDLASNMRKLLEIIGEMDISQYANRYVEVVPIEYADLNELISDLYQILAIPGAAAPLEQITEQPVEQPEGEEPAVTEPVSPVVPPGTQTNLYPITRLNALMISTNNPEVIALVKKWISILDQPSAKKEEELEEVVTEQKNYVYPVKYSKAEELAQILAQVYAEGVQPIQPEEPVEPEEEQQQQQPNQQIENDEEQAPVFIPDQTTNSIIIRATPTQYAQINTLLERLDQRPLQVLIDVIIAEVTLTDSDTFGVRGMLQSEGQLTIGGETNAVNASAETNFPGVAGGDGFSYAINAPGRFLAQLRALATESRVKVLSAPNILVRNNQQAKINVGDSIPIRTIRGEGEDAEETVEYKETGIILTVTPQINLEGDVVMEILQEVSAPGTRESGEIAPPITTTTAQTFLLTKDGHPLVIGGLIRTTDSKNSQGIPLLKDLPLIGRLFRYKDQQSIRRELVILVTPRIVKTAEQGWQLTDDVLQGRVKRLEELFNREESDADKIKRFLKNQFDTQE